MQLFQYSMNHAAYGILARKMRIKKRNGFTIIEVLIVLVITSVILLMVFMGVSQLRRNSRDAARVRFATNIPQQYVEYYKYNMSYPNNALQRQSFLDNYVSVVNDPLLGTPYTVDFRNGRTAPHTGTPPVGSVYIMQYHWCNDTDSSDGTANLVAGDDTAADQIVVWFGTETGQYKCVDNH